MADRRDGTTWVALELTPHGEKLIEEDPDLLARETRRQLGVDEQWPIFIPAKAFAQKGKKRAVQLFKGYILVAAGLNEVEYFRLEQTKLVEQVISGRDQRGVRILTTIKDSQVAELRRRLMEEVASDIVPGMQVTVTEGLYAQFEGTVVDTEGDHAVVRFELRSIQGFFKVPKVFLETA